MPDFGINQPHDKLFKLAFKNRPTAIAAFRALLPEKFTQRLDWSTTALQPGSYVDKEFKTSESDLLYRVKSRESEALLYLLFEHQTTEDPWLALRLLSYEVRIWNDYRKAHPRARALRVIIPLVLAQNERSWALSPRFASLFQLSEEDQSAYAECIPDFTFRLVLLCYVRFLPS